MVQTLFELLSGWVADRLVALLCWIILLPLVLLVSLPFIRLIALFRHGRYDLEVMAMIASVYSSWRALGW